MQRAQPVSAEARFWARLRDRRFAGLKFVRQALVGAYFVDFLCREHKLIVEIDGATHGTGEELAIDRLRQAALEDLGYRVFRASNTDAYTNIDGVLNAPLCFVELPDA